MNLTTIDIDLAKSHSRLADMDQHKNDVVADIDVFAIALFAGAR